MGLLISSDSGAQAFESSDQTLESSAQSYELSESSAPSYEPRSSFYVIFERTLDDPTFKTIFARQRQDEARANNEYDTSMLTIESFFEVWVDHIVKSLNEAVSSAVTFLRIAEASKDEKTCLAALATFNRTIPEAMNDYARRMIESESIKRLCLQQAKATYDAAIQAAEATCCSAIQTYEASFYLPSSVNMSLLVVAS